MNEPSSLLDQLIERLQEKEGLEVEYKKAKGGLPNSLWETVSAFANTSGGWLILGVDERDDQLILEGVPNARKRLKNFYDILRNTQKINYPVCGANDATIESLAGVDVIVIRVPKAPRRTGPVYIGKDPYAGTYVRRHEGDYVARPQEVDRMFREKSSQSSDGTILPHFTMADIDPESLRGYRQRFQTHDRTSVLNNYDDEAFLRGIVGYATDRETGKSGLTVAGLLLLGTSSALQEWRGRHLIDFRVEPREVTYDRRWLERIAWDGNLFRAYEMIYGRLLANQPASFQLKDGVRTQEGPVQIALREALANLLVHADYGETDASLIVQRPEGYLLRNPGSSLIPASELLSGTRSEPRNPLLVRMFMRVGFAEEAGTGITQIVSAWRDLGFRLPSIDVGTERYEFSISLRYVHLISDDDRTWLATATHNWTQHEQLALVLAKNDGDVDNERLRAVTNLHPTDAGRVLSSLRDRAFLEKTGSGRATIYRLGPALPPMEMTIPEHDDQTNTQLSFDDKGPYIDDNDHGSDDKGPYIDDNDHGSDDRDVYSDDMHEIQGGMRTRLEQIARLSREQQRLVPQQRNEIIVALCWETPLSVSQIAQMVAPQGTVDAGSGGGWGVRLPHHAHFAGRGGAIHGNLAPEWCRQRAHAARGTTIQRLKMPIHGSLWCYRADHAPG